MKKMSTLFKKDPNDLGRVLDDEYNEENLWVFDEGVKATRKFDGTACAIIDGELYKRYDAKKGKKAPEGAIPCQEADEITGHHPHWVKCVRGNKSEKYHWEAFDRRKDNSKDGTFELIGPKVQGNPEGASTHLLVRHGMIDVYDIEEVLKNPKEFMKYLDIEGIVFHHPDGRMCKIRKKDFGMKRK